jgi:hypothetical protein
MASPIKFAVPADLVAPALQNGRTEGHPCSTSSRPIQTTLVARIHSRDCESPEAHECAALPGPAGSERASRISRPASATPAPTAIRTTKKEDSHAKIGNSFDARSIGSEAVLHQSGESVIVTAAGTPSTSTPGEGTQYKFA